eukprot:scaffold15633_cov107-Isochrysis_galbana.AAC.1
MAHGGAADQARRAPHVAHAQAEQPLAAVEAMPQARQTQPRRLPSAEIRTLRTSGCHRGGSWGCHGWRGGGTGAGVRALGAVAEERRDALCSSPA